MPQPPSASARAAMVLLVTLSGALARCKATPIDPLDAAPSPQANAEPAPLASLVSAGATAGSNSAGDAGPAAEALRIGRAPAPDSPRELAREPGVREAAHDNREARELVGYALQALLRTGEGPPAPKGAEVNIAAIEAAKRRAEARIAIEASQTRARFVFSGGFVLPQGTEVRARVDRYGHIVLWPGELTYRIAEPGVMRALLGERRMDVAPLSRAEVTPAGDGQRRLNLPTRRVDVSTRAAKGALELATVRDAGDGGVLVCRLLLDLMNAPPSTAPCVTDEMPLHAELRWTTQGALTFDVTSILRRSDLSPARSRVAAGIGRLRGRAAAPPKRRAAHLEGGARGVPQRADRRSAHRRARCASTSARRRAHADQLDRRAPGRVDRRRARRVGRSRQACNAHVARPGPLLAPVAHFSGRRVGAARDRHCAWVERNRSG